MGTIISYSHSLEQFHAFCILHVHLSSLSHLSVRQALFFFRLPAGQIQSAVCLHNCTAQNLPSFLQFPLATCLCLLPMPPATTSCLPPVTFHIYAYTDYACWQLSAARSLDWTCLFTTYLQGFLPLLPTTLFFLHHYLPGFFFSCLLLEDVGAWVEHVGTFWHRLKTAF